MSTTTDLRAVGLLERAVGYTRGCLALVDDPLLPRPTPCSAWDLRALLEHMDDSLATFAEAATAGRVAPLPVPPPDALLPADLLVDRLRVRACAVLGGWAHGPAEGRLLVDEAGPLGAGLVAGVGALEIAVHGWDVATACGADVPLPEALAAELLRLAGSVVADADRPHRFGPALPPASAGAGDRLLALLGRRPAVGGRTPDAPHS